MKLTPKHRLTMAIVALAMLFGSYGSFAQSTINGRITGDGEPLPGVNVLIQGTSQGTTTDVDGNYSLSVPSDATTLIYSFVGYKSQLVAIGNRSAIDILMEEDISALEELVVVGYGEQKKVNLTGAVDNISSDRLSALAVNTVGEALQGQLPGVYVNTADGKPGRAPSYNIRGFGSINGGGSPLIVIDGVPQTTTDLNNISPYDIEDISVLKDAASTAIYGARASYGVILVTTKKGEGKLKIDYSNNFGWRKATRVPEVYNNPFDYLEISEREFTENIGQGYFTDEQVEYAKNWDPSQPAAQLVNIGGRANLLLGGTVHNYYKEWFHEYSPQMNHRLAVSGASDKISYYISGDYWEQNGALKFKPEDIKRYTLRTNLRYDINDHITLSNITALTRRDEEHPNQYLYGFTSNVYRFIENSNPMMPEYVDVDGEMIPTDIGFYREFLEKQSGIEKVGNDLKTTLALDFSYFNDKLKMRVDATYQNGNLNDLIWRDNKGPYLSNAFNNRNIILDSYQDAGPSRIARSNTETTKTNINAYATYDHSIGDHNFTIMGGYQQESFELFSIFAEKEFPLQVDQHSLNLASGTASVGDDDSRFSARSVFGRFNYNWKGKYLLEVNTSYFLSSKFAEESRGKGYIAASGAWRVSEEGFFDGIRSTVNNFKIRASYGSIGNTDIGAYDYIPVLSVSEPWFILEGDRVNATSSPDPKSSNFTWETVKTINFGVDLSFLKNRLTTSFDIYQRTTEDMLANSNSLPSVFGAPVPKENVATLETNGWELSMGWSDQVGNSGFNYGIRFNISDYESEITSYYNPTNFLGDYYVGQKIGEIWGLTTLGYFQSDDEADNGAVLTRMKYKAHIAEGSIKFDDKDGNGAIDFGDRTLENPGDYRIIGNTTPRYQYGISANAGYKGFDLNFFFHGVGKRDVYPGHENVSFWGVYNRKYQVLIQHVVDDRWTPENPDAYFPLPQGYMARDRGDLGENQTKYMQSASFLRLKNLVLGYTLPSSLTERVKISKLRVYLSGQNLWETTKLHDSLDPEGIDKDPDANSRRVGIGTSFPIQRVYSFGLQLQF